jgi:hypothetical protein
MCENCEDCFFQVAARTHQGRGQLSGACGRTQAYGGTHPAVFASVNKLVGFDRFG